MEKAKKAFILLLLTISSTAIAACEEQGPAENAGEQIDEAVEDVGDDIEDATD